MNVYLFTYMYDVPGSWNRKIIMYLLVAEESKIVEVEGVELKVEENKS